MNFVNFLRSSLGAQVVFVTHTTTDLPSPREALWTTPLHKSYSCETTQTISLNATWNYPNSTYQIAKGFEQLKNLEQNNFNFTIEMTISKLRFDAFREVNMSRNLYQVKVLYLNLSSFSISGIIHMFPAQEPQPYLTNSALLCSCGLHGGSASRGQAQRVPLRKVPGKSHNTTGVANCQHGCCSGRPQPSYYVDTITN